MDYQLRLNNALKDYHKEVYDNEKKNIKDEYREDCDCPVCGSKNYSVYCVKDGFIHRRCSNCSLVYLSPRFNNAATAGFYNSKANEVYNETKFHESTGSITLDDSINNENLQLLLKYLPGNRGNLNLLEVGSGKGFFLRKAKEKGFNVYGLELNKKLFNLSKDISGHIYHQDLFERKFEDSFFDVIYMRDVIEHIPNPVPFLKELNRIAKKGCILMFDTHNIDSIVNSLTKEYHTVIFAFEHPIHWSSKTLALAGKNAGFHHIKTYYNHDYQALRYVLSYKLDPSFTYIFKPNNTFGLLRKLNWIVSHHRLLHVLRFLHLDQFMTKNLSILLGKGATMKVILVK